MRPNILFIMSDDHGANAISAYGSRLAKVFQTPNIDRIGREGVIMSGCFCTNALCCPSRASILTGLYSHKNGVKTLCDELSPELPTVPLILSDAGYQTALFGKWHLYSEPQGFDEYSVLPGQGRYFQPNFINKGADWRQIAKYDDEAGEAADGYVTDIITDRAIHWLSRVERDRPFLLMCHHKAPHDDFEYHPRYEHMLDGIEIPEPESLFEDKAHRSEGSRNYGGSVTERYAPRNLVSTMSHADYPTGALYVEGLDAKGRAKAAYQKYLKDYLRTVAGIDDSVGRLLRYLDDEGFSENTLVVYTSDQGMFLGEHDYIDKRWIYDEAMQMPLLVRYPREIPAGRICDQLVSNVDFAQTLLDYAGLDAPHSKQAAAPPIMQGKSFRQLMNGTTDEAIHEYIYYRYWMHMAHLGVPAHYGIRTADKKLIFFYGLPLDSTEALPELTPPGFELYDLKNDPQETSNVYNDPAYHDKSALMRAYLMRAKEETGDTDEGYPELEAVWKGCVDI